MKEKINYVRIANVLLTIIYTAGFRVVYDKVDQRFKLIERDVLIGKKEKWCKTCNDIAYQRRRP